MKHLDRAVARTLQELFELGMFENPYRDPKEAVKAVAEQKDWDAAAKAHRQSVVLLKNKDVLPLTEEKLKGKNIYVEAFHKDAEQSKKIYRGFERNVLRCNADRKSEGSGLCDPDDFSVQWRVF